MKQIGLILLFLFMTPSLVKAESRTRALAKNLDLDLWSEGRPWTYPGVHKVFADGILNRAMLVVENISGHLDRPLLKDYGKYIVYQYQRDAAHFDSIAFTNISLKDVKKALQNSFGERSFVFLKTIFQKLNPLASARADTSVCAADLSASSPSIESDMNNLASSYSGGHWKVASGCLMGALEGVYDSTVGMGVSLWEGSKALLSDPKVFWDDKVEQFQKLKEFFVTFESSMKQFAIGVMALPNEVKAQIFCSFVSGIGVDVLASIFVGGATLGLVAVKAAKYFKRINSIGKLVARVQKIGKLNRLGGDFFARLIKMPDKVANVLLRRMRTFGDHGMDDLALKLGSCAL